MWTWVGLPAAFIAADNTLLGVVSKSFSAWMKNTGTFALRAAWSMRSRSGGSGAHDSAAPAKSTAAVNPVPRSAANSVSMPPNEQPIVAIRFGSTSGIAAT